MKIRYWLCALLLCNLGVAPAWAEFAVIRQEKSAINDIYITKEAEGWRCLRFSLTLPGRQSCVDPAAPQRLTFQYTQAMMGALLLQPQPKRILMIGLGGGSLPMALRRVLPETQIDAVEIDPAVAQVAEKEFFFKSDARMKVHIGDGRAFVQQAAAAGKAYDIVFLDAFSKYYIPEHLLTVEFLREVKGILAAGGVAVANTASNSGLYAVESATYAAVYGSFYNVKFGARIIFAARDALPPATVLQENAARWADRLAPVGVDVTKLLPLFISTPDWPADAQVLTDKYHPANELNRQP